MRARGLLRQLAPAARDRPLARYRPPADPLVGAQRGLGLVLSGRAVPTARLTEGRRGWIRRAHGRGSLRSAPGSSGCWRPAPVDWTRLISATRWTTPTGVRRRRPARRST